MYAARLRLIDQVRANGPVRDWSSGTDAERADLQDACEVYQPTLQKAIDEIGPERKHGRGTLRRATVAAVGHQMPSQPGTPHPT